MKLSFNFNKLFINFWWPQLSFVIILETLSNEHLIKKLYLQAYFPSDLYLLGPYVKLVLYIANYCFKCTIKW